MNNKVFNNEADAAVFIWINSGTGKTFVSVNSKTEVDKNRYNDWIYNRLTNYERQMKTGDKRMPAELLEDASNNNKFRTIVITFNDKWSALDYSNQLVDVLKNNDTTYCSKVKYFWSVEKDEDRMPTVFGTFKNKDFSSVSDGYTMEQLIYDTVPFEGFIDSRDREIDIDHNAYTEQLEEKKKAKQEPKYKYCPLCGMQLTMAGLCEGSSRCDNYGEKVENPLIR